MQVTGWLAVLDREYASRSSGQTERDHHAVVVFHGVLDNYVRRAKINHDQRSK